MRAPPGLFTEFERTHSRRGTRVTHMIGIPLVVLSVPLALVAPILALKLFVTGWVLQLAGHYVFEGSSPRLIPDPRDVVVGVLWAAREWQRLLRRVLRRQER